MDARSSQRGDPRNVVGASRSPMNGPVHDSLSELPQQPLPTPIALAVGVDVIERERVIQAYKRFGDRFLRRVFTDREVEQASGRIEKLVSRFAVKEAVSKALGTGIGKIAWREIEVQRLVGGKPALHLSGRAAERALSLGLSVFDVSVSDTTTHTFAIVVAAGVKP